jgi:hypothetical protein
MNDAKTGLFGKVLGMLQILVSIFVLDLNSWNQIIVSVLLFLGGLLMLTMDADSKFIRGARSFISYAAILISVALIIKVLATG